MTKITSVIRGGNQVESDFQIFVVFFLAVSAVSLAVIAKGVFAIRDVIARRDTIKT